MKQATVVIDIPTDKWVETIKIFTDQLQRPPQLSPGSTVETATDAIWKGDGEELHLHKTSEADFVGKPGSETLFEFKDLSRAEGFFNAMTKPKMYRVKEPIHPVTIFPVYPKASVRKFTTGTFTIHSNDKDLASSATGGVIHNPPDRSSTKFNNKRRHKHKSSKGMSGLLLGSCAAVGCVAFYFLFTRLDK